MAYESTNALLNLANLKRQKKQDKWSALKDVAGFGMGLWEKLSRMPEAKEMADYEQQLALGRLSAEEAAGEKRYLREDAAGRARDIERFGRDLQLEGLRGKREKDVAALYAGKDNEKQQREMQADIDAYVTEALPKMRPDLFITDAEGMMTLDFSKKDALRKLLLSRYSYIKDAGIQTWLSGYIDDMLNSGVMPAKPGKDSAVLGQKPYQTLESASKTAQDLYRLLKGVPDLLPDERAEVEKQASIIESPMMPGVTGSVGTTSRDAIMSRAASQLKAIYDAYVARKGQETRSTRWQDVAR